MFLDSDQLQTSVVLVFLFAAIAGVLVFHRGAHRIAIRRWGTYAIGVFAVLAITSWCNFGKFHVIFTDAPDATAGSPGRKKIERHLPFHFHEFFHYYVGSKYFRELGYEGLYDCTALADAENAEELHVRPRINGFVRDLDDVLRDKTYDEAKTHCQNELYPRFSAQRWASFKADLRELQTLVPDDWWGGVTFDAGFNPPPSWVLVGGTFSNLIPIHLGSLPTYLLATSLDMMLVVGCFFALRAAFGAATAATAAVFFGATFVASYGWNGGAFLRYTWVVAVACGLVAMARGRWALAGALLGAATCDRIFPGGFAVGAMIPVAYRALRLRSEEDRRHLLRFGAGFGGAVAGLVLLSLVVFGFAPWQIFFSRILRHGDVYYVMHIGLKKVLTWRQWVPSQDFRWHKGLQNFHDWNLRLRDTWASMRLVAVPIQLAAVGGAGLAATRRRPYEAALLFGVVGMFFFNIPANYYYVVLVLVPALLLRAAIVAPTLKARLTEYAALTGFVVFWLTTIIASRLANDDIVYNHLICVWLLLFLVAWIALWAWPAMVPLAERAQAWWRSGGVLQRSGRNS
jgi:hypothetical protein